MFGDTTVDKKILQMEFDNSKFDKNVEHSKKTFEDFKDTLDFDETSSGLTKFFEETGVLAFNKLSDNVQALTDKLTGLGDVGEYVISRIRSSMEGAARYIESFAKSLSIDQIDVGQSKYDALNKAVMTITADGKVAEEEAYSVFERLMTYTNETSYSFSDMVHQISAFNATGQDLHASEMAMEGIANAAAKAGQGTQQATAAMQVFAKAMGSGFLNKNQWDSLNLTAHMITREFRQVLVDTAAEVGTLQKVGDTYRVGEAYRSDAARNAKDELAAAQQKAAQKNTQANIDRVEKLQKKVAQYDQQMTVAVDNLENSLHNKWLTNEVLMKALQKYYFEGIDDPNADWDTFAGQAAKAAQRALSLADAINAMKEAVSAGWMTSFRLFWGDLAESMQFFTNVANRAIEILDRISEWRNGVLEVWANEGGRVSFAKLIFGDYGSDIEEGVVGLLDLLEDAGDFIATAFFDFFKIFVPAEMREYWDDDGFKEAWFGGQLYNFTNSISQFFTGIRHFFDEELEINGQTKTRLEVVHEIVQGVIGALNLGYQAMTAFMGFLGEIAFQLTPSLDAILAFFSQLGISIYGSAEAASDGQTLPKFFHELAEEFRPLTEGINNFVFAISNLLLAILGINEDKDITGAAFRGLGEAIRAIAQTISTVGAPILNFLTSLANVITSLIQNGFSEESLSAAGQAMSQAFITLIDSILGSFPNNGGFIGQAIRELFGLTSEEEAAQSNSLFTFLHNVFVSAFDLFKKFTDGFFNGFNLSTLIKDGFGFGAARNFLNTVVGFFKGLNLYNVIMSFLGVATLIEFIKLIRSVTKVTNMVKSFFGDVVGSLMGGITDQFGIYADKLLTVSKALGLFALSVAALGSLSLPALLQGIAALGVIMIAITVFNHFMTKAAQENLTLKDQLGKSASLLSMATVLIGLATVITAISVGFSLLSLAIVPLASDPIKMLTAVGGIIAILGALGLFIYLMMRGLTSLSKQVTTFQSKNSLFSRSSNGLGKIALLMLGLGASIILISAGISLLMLAIVPLANSGWDGLARGLLGLLGVLVLIGGFMAIMTHSIKESKWGDIGKTAMATASMVVSIGLLAGSIALLVLALTPLSLVSWEGFARMFAGLAAMLVLLGGFILAINKFGETTKTTTSGSGILGNFMREKESKELTARIKGLAGLALSIGVLVLALTPLSAMSWEGWGRSMLGLLGILVMLGSFIGIVKHFDLNNVEISGLIVFTLGIVLLVQSIKGLAQLEWGQLAVGLTGLLGILVLLSGFMGIMKHFKLSSVEITGVIAFAAGIWILVQSMLPLAALDLNQIITGLVGLTGILALVWGFMALMSDMKTETKTALTALGLLLGLGLLMVIFSLTLNDVKNIPWETIAAFSAGLAVMIIAIAGALAIVGKMSISSGIKGVLVLSAGIAAILAVVSAMIPMILGAIGTGLADAGGKLALASGTISEFIDRMNGISDGSVDHAKSVLDKLKEIIQSTAGFGGYSSAISGFTTALYDLGSGLVIFQNYMSQITTTGTSDAISLIERLAETASGLQSVASVNLSSFTAGLTGLGGALGIYAMGASEVSNITPGKTPDVGNAIYILEELSKGLIEHGGFQIPPDMPSEEALGVFGAQLSALAMAMVKFEQSGSQLGEGTDKALAALDFMTNIKSRLTTLDTIKSVVDFFTKDQITPDVMEEFGKNIEQLGLALASFSKSTTTVDKKTGEVKALDFSAALLTLDEFVKLKAKLPVADPTWLQWLTGTKENLTTLGGEIESAGTALSDFSTKASQAVGTDSKVNNMKTALAALNTIATFMNNLALKMPRIGGAKAMFDTLANGRQKTITEFGTEVEAIGNSLASFGPNLNTFTDNAAKAVGTDAKKKAMEDGLKAINTITSFIGKLSIKMGHIGGVKAVWDTFWGGRDKTITEMGSDIESLGTSLGAFSTGLKTFTDNSGAAVGTEEKKQNMNAGLKAINTIVSFMTQLSLKLPMIGGVKNLWDTFWNGHKQDISDIGSDIGDLGTSLGQFGTAISGKFKDSINTQNAIDTIKSYMSLIESIADLDDGFGIGPSVLSYTTSLLDFVHFMVNGITGDYAGYTRDGVERVGIIDDMVTMMVTISNKVKQMGGVNGEAIQAFRDLAQAIAFFSQIDVKKNFVQVGTAIADGVERGIKDGTTRVSVAAANMAIAAYNAAMERLKASSPSKLFTKVGSYVPLGFALGVEGDTGVVVNAIDGMTGQAIDSAATLMSEISRLMAEDTDANPTITPVLDLSNVEQGIDYINGNLHRGPVQLRAGLSSAYASSVGGNAAGSENQNGTDLSGVYERMGILGEQITELGESIKKMKFVLNTGVIAGEITDQIDINLGRRSYYSGRRN